MKFEKTKEIMELPLKDRIVSDSESGVKNVLNYIERTKEEFDYARYIMNKPSKSGFYNTHCIDGDAVIKEYSNADKMILVKMHDIIVFPALLLNFVNYDGIPDIGFMQRFIYALYDRYWVSLDDIKTYKTKLEYTHSMSELVDYESVGDEEFLSDKLARIRKLREAGCRTYEDYNKMYGWR